MRKATYSVIIALLCSIAFVSCEKEYHCGCTFNNSVVFTKDLGHDLKKNAETACKSYDSTVTGETWNCTLY